MIVKSEHEIFRRRGGRNAALGYALGGFVVLIMIVTMAKLADGDLMKGYDYERPQPQGVVVVE